MTLSLEAGTAAGCQPDRGDAGPRRALAVPAAVFVVALVARVCWTLASAGTGPLFDKYFWLAKKLQGAGWIPDVAFTSSPLYTYLAALFTLGFGWGETGIRLLQSGVGALAIATAWLAFRDLAGGRAATLAAGILALHPTLVLYDTQPLPECWINLANATSLLLLGRLHGRGAWRGAALLGLVTGLSVLLRPTALIWLALAPLSLLAGRRPAPARLLAPLVVAFACAVAPVAWINARAEGRLILSTTTGGLNLFNGNSHENKGYTFLSPRSVKHLENVILGDVLRQPITPEHLAWKRAAEWAAGREMTLQESSDFWVGEVRAYAVREPLAFLRGLARKLRFSLHAYEPHDTESARDRGGLFGPYAFWFPAVVWALALVGVGLTFPRWRQWYAPLGLLAAYLASCAALYVSSRLRAPALLPVALFAAAAALAIADAVSGRRRARLAALAVACVLALGVAAWPHRLFADTARTSAILSGLISPGMERYRRGDIEGALILLERAATQQPSLAWDIALLLADGRGDPLVKSFTDGLFEWPADTRGDKTGAGFEKRLRAAVAALREGRADEALAEISEAVAADPWNWDLHNARAIVLVRLERWDEALGEYEQAFTLGRKFEPDTGNAYRDMAACALRAGRSEQAHEYERRAALVDRLSKPWVPGEVGTVVRAAGRPS